jgi:hypothetical protein
MWAEKDFIFDLGPKKYFIFDKGLQPLLLMYLGLKIFSG